MEEKDIFSGDSVEEAIASGLEALGLARDQVEIDVLDEGSRGILGIGARPARVRLIPVPSSYPEPPAPPAAAEPPPPEPEPFAPPEEAEPESEPELEPELDPAEVVAQSVLAELLEKMGFSAEIQVHRAEPSADEEEGPLVLDVHGAGVDTLIGRKGETLASLQRIVRLIARQQASEWVNLVVDVAGYKQRREGNLRRLAERMADRAVRDAKKVVLEPMPAFERRIVHLALRGRQDVSTESEGAGGHRRVTIIPN